MQIIKHTALTTQQQSLLVDQLRERFPLITDFGPREPPARKVPQMSGLTALDQAGLRAAQVYAQLYQEFVPASEKNIESYQKAYPKWLADCEEMFAKLHKVLDGREPAPSLSFSASNAGGRPGNDVLVTMEAVGNFLIWPPSRDDDDEENDELSKAGKTMKLTLPPAPEAPSGRWQQRSLDFAGLSLGSRSRLSVASDYRALVPNFRHLGPRDPNRFYWKPRKPMSPSRSIGLECAQWRHAVAPQVFSVEIFWYPDVEAAELRGMIECRIHAENLSKPESLRVPIRLTVKAVDTFDVAKRLVEEGCTQHPKGLLGLLSKSKS